MGFELCCQVSSFSFTHWSDFEGFASSRSAHFINKPLAPFRGTTSFRDDPISGAIEVEDFNEGATLVGEEEGCSAGRVDFDGVASEFGEPVE